MYDLIARTLDLDFGRPIWSLLDNFAVLLGNFKWPSFKNWHITMEPILHNNLDLLDASLSNSWNQTIKATTATSYTAQVTYIIHPA